MKNGNERKFRRYAEYYKIAYNKSVWIDKVHKAPTWCRDKRKNSYAVYFRENGMDNGRALMTGHGPTYDAAFGMLLEFYMGWEGAASNAEMEIRYATAGM